MLRSRSLLSLSGVYIPDDSDVGPDTATVANPSLLRVAVLAIATCVCFVVWHESTSHVTLHFRFPYFVAYAQAVVLFIVHGVAGELTAAVDRYRFDVAFVHRKTLTVSVALFGMACNRTHNAQRAQFLNTLVFCLC